MSNLTTSTAVCDRPAENRINEEWLAAYNELRKRYPNADLFEVMDAASQRVATPSEYSSDVLDQMELEERWEDAKAVDEAQYTPRPWELP